jgi:hypothetical protein
MDHLNFNLIKDVDGDLCLKRLTTFVMLNCILAGFIGDTFLGYKVSEYMLMPIVTVLIGSLGLQVAADKIRPFGGGDH